jgi:hypothetical protein
MHLSLPKIQSYAFTFYELDPFHHGIVCRKGPCTSYSTTVGCMYMKAFKFVRCTIERTSVPTQPSTQSIRQRHPCAVLLVTFVLYSICTVRCLLLMLIPTSRKHRDATSEVIQIIITFNIFVR